VKGLPLSLRIGHPEYQSAPPNHLYASILIDSARRCQWWPHTIEDMTLHAFDLLGCCVVRNAPISACYVFASSIPMPSEAVTSCVTTGQRVPCTPGVLARPFADLLSCSLTLLQLIPRWPQCSPIEYPAIELGLANVEMGWARFNRPADQRVGYRIEHDRVYLWRHEP
jgi:hypothetical protein